MKNFKKICITTIVGLSILGTSVFALTGTVNAPSGLVLRGEASKSGEPLATVPDKTEVSIIEESEEWYKVTYNEQEGYLFKEYVNIEETEDEVSTQEIENTDENTQNVQATGKIKVYMIPVITSTVIDEIEANQEIVVVKEITNWSYVTSGDIQGWVRTYGIKDETQDVEDETIETSTDGQTAENADVEGTISTEEQTTSEEEPADNSDAEETTSTISKGFVAVDFANVRKAASTSSAIVTTLTKNTSFKVLAETEEWYKIKYTSPTDDIYEGYIYKELVSASSN